MEKIKSWGPFWSYQDFDFSNCYGCQTFILAEIHCYLSALKSWHNNSFLSGVDSTENWHLIPFTIFTKGNVLVPWFLHSYCCFYLEQNFKRNKWSFQILPGGIQFIIQFCVIFQLFIKVFCHKVKLKNCTNLGSSWQNLVEPFNSISFQLLL